MSSAKRGKGFWGPPKWESLHIDGATFRPENAEIFVDNLWNMTKVLPCEVCKKNLTAKLQKYPPEPYLTNNHNAFFYTYFLHDLVNQDLGKKSPPFDEVKALYFRALGQECRDCKV